MWKSRATAVVLLFALSATTGCKWIAGEKPTLLKQLETAVPAIQSAAESGSKTADALTEFIAWLHAKAVAIYAGLAALVLSVLRYFTGFKFGARRRSGSSGPSASSRGGSSGS